MLTVIVFFILINGSAFYVYAVGGIIRDVPELGVEKSFLPERLNMFSSRANINIKYNEDVRSLNRPFLKNDKIKVLVVGDSYARDFVNLLLESSLEKNIEISYIDELKFSADNENRFIKANKIFYATNHPSRKTSVMENIKMFDINMDEFWVVGPKDFGNSNGIFYNRIRNGSDCLEYRTSMKKGVLEINCELKAEWEDKYIDLISLVLDGNSKVLVFTPECKFISQDTLHLTKYGAKFFATLLDSKLREIIYSK